MIIDLKLCRFILRFPQKKATEFYEGETLEKVCAIKEAAYREYVKRTDITPHFSFYKVTVGMITINEVTGKEKTTKVLAQEQIQIFGKIFL